MLPKQPIPWRRRAKLQELKASIARFTHAIEVSADRVLACSGYLPRSGATATAKTELFAMQLAKAASSPPPILRKKDEPDDPIPMPVDPGHPDRPLSPTTSSIQNRIEGMYAAMSAPASSICQSCWRVHVYRG